MDCSFILQGLAWFLIPLGLVYPATRFTNVEYTSLRGDITLHAYLSTPPPPKNYNNTSLSHYPAAIVFHAWNGISEESIYFSNLLAEQGFIAIAPDLFRGVASADRNLPWNILTVFLTPQQRMNDDVDAAIRYLMNNGSDNIDLLAGGGSVVDMSKLFSGPGFCYGGSQALELSTRFPVAGTVSLYGAVIDEFQDPTNNDERWGILGINDSSLLGIYGEDDGNPNPTTVRGFQAAMNARNINNTVTFYPNVGHAFINPMNHMSGQQQAVAAWDQVIDYMNTVVDNNVRYDDDGTSGGRRNMEIFMKKYAQGAKKTSSSSSSTSSSSLSWILDHTMDFFQQKGHFHRIMEHHQHH